MSRRGRSCGPALVPLHRLLPAASPTPTNTDIDTATPSLMNTTTHPAEPTLTPVPPFLPPLSDQVLLLLLPIVAYWSFSLFFHFLDTHDLLSQYRLHTPAEVLKRNHVTRREVVRDVILQQAIQTVVGYILTLTEPEEMRGAEGIEVLSLYSRLVWAEGWLRRALAIAGIDGLGLEKTIGSGFAMLGRAAVWQKVVQFAGLSAEGDWRMQVVELAYWYLIPAMRIGLAIFILDTWQYFLHRLMHESKWLYSKFPTPLVEAKANPCRNVSLAPPPSLRSIRLWSPLQPPNRGLASRHHWRRSRVQNLRLTLARGNVLFPAVDYEDRR